MSRGHEDIKINFSAHEFINKSKVFGASCREMTEIQKRRENPFKFNPITNQQSKTEIKSKTPIKNLPFID